MCCKLGLMNVVAACFLPCCRAIGDIYNYHLDPSLTLGCGSWGSTSVSANVGPQHLINVKTGMLPWWWCLLGHIRC